MGGHGELGARAVVVGGGVVGLASAAALATRGVQVTLVERDRLPADAAPRRGTPQAPHVHALLAGGARALAELFSGLDDELDGFGAEAVASGTGFGFRNAHGWTLGTTGLSVRCVSRPGLEAVLRRRIVRNPQVRVRDGSRVRGLRFARDRVTGVEMVDDTGTAVENADLVVDATGRGSPVPSWLAAAGHATPPEREVDAGLWYASTLGTGDIDLPDPMRSFLVTPTASCPRGTAVIRREDGRYTVSVTGLGSDDPPRSVSALRRHADGVASPVAGRALRSLDLADEVTVTRSTGNRVRRYDLVPPPAGLVVLGDAVCCTDPVYGQGMSVAALQAVALGGLVDEYGVRSRGLVPAVQRAAWRVAQRAWNAAVGADAQLPTVQLPPPPLRTRSLQAYVGRLSRLSTVDPVVARAFGRVVHLVDPPEVLFSPRLLARAARDVVAPARVPLHPADAPTPTSVPARG